VALAGLALVLLMPRAGWAQPTDRNRPIRVGNLNVLAISGGYRQHDHPTFSRSGFLSMGYQRRVLWREIRMFPIWVRGGFDCPSETVATPDAFSVWNAGDISGGALPFREYVQERTSDFALRFELVADVLNLPNLAIYGGGGLVIHILSYSSRGTTSRNLFDSRENLLGPSLVAGSRLFMRSQPWGVFSEVRYRRVYGRLATPQDGKPYFTEQSFDYEWVNSVSVEGGLALHW